MKLHSLLLSTAVAVFTVNSVIAAPTDVLATVNSTAITQHMFDLYSKQRGVENAGKIPADQKKRLVDELVNRELLFRAALEQKLESKPDVSAELDNARMNILASNAVRNEIEVRSAISDDKLKEEYQSFLKGLSGLEYKTRHILVDNEDKAKALVAELDKGGDFAKLANDNATGAPDGGELEWFSPDDMIKPFVDAVVKLKKDQYTKAPVQTQYGWHIIQLQDTRKVPPPAFEDVKEQLLMNARNTQIENFLKGLRAKAKIEVK